MATGWIKLHRDLLDWEWYRDIKTKTLFIHLILKANHEPRRWKGITVGRGQLVTGLSALSEETGLSVQSVRTSLTRLEKTGEINRQSNNHYSIITICNYELFQDGEIASNKQSNKRPTGKQQASNNKQEVKKLSIKEKNTIDFDFLKNLLERGVDEQVAKDWLEVRRKKKASNTQTAFKGLETQVSKSGLTWNEAITIAVTRSWSGFNADWVEAESKQSQSNHVTDPDVAARLRRVVEAESKKRSL